jgi:tRNA dimethylallyltransferase
LISVLIIGGPTGCGKNRLALHLARVIPCEIVNADSRQIYRDLVIGTNQPSIEEQKLVPHHLFGFLPPHELFSAAQFEKKAAAVVSEIQTRGNLPILVGGTGFYIKAFLKGTWSIPQRDPALKNRIEKIESRHPKHFLHRMLIRIDPSAATTIAPNDRYRVKRALEIYFQTGTKLTDHRQSLPDRFTACKVFVDQPQEILRINLRARVVNMLENGWVDEVKSLLNRYPEFESMPASGSLGYPEIIRYLKGGVELEELKNQIALKTWQYAKRQRTWFRNQDRFIRMDSHLQELHKMQESVLQCLRDKSSHVHNDFPGEV